MKAKHALRGNATASAETETAAVTFDLYSVSDFYQQILINKIRVKSRVQIFWRLRVDSLEWS
jgi:hypothetical protein